jgi:uncharacterized membrane protein (UPF0127 family)
MFSKDSSKEVKSWHLVVLGIIFVCFLGVRFFSPGAQKSTPAVFKEAQIGLASTTIKVLVADTPTAAYQGLSDRASLGAYDGMLFVFPEAATRTFVMRRMQFPLDMVWITNGMVTDVKKQLPLEDVQFDSQLKLYSGAVPADMVLEVASGTADKLGFKVGDRLKLGY